MAAEPTARLEAMVVVVDHSIVEIVHSLLVVAAYTSPSTSTLLLNGQKSDNLMNAINGDEMKYAE